MGAILEALEKQNRESAAALLKNVPVQYDDLSRLSPTVVVGVGEAGTRVLDYFKKRVKENSLFLKEIYDVTQDESSSITTALVPDALQQPLSLVGLPFFDDFPFETEIHSLEEQDILDVRPTVPTISKDLLDQYPELASWVHERLMEEIEKDEYFSVVISAINARLKFFIVQEAVEKYLRDAISRAVTLRPDLSQGGLLSGIGRKNEVKIIIAVSSSHPCSSVLPDLVAKSSVIASEIGYSARVAIVLVDDSKTGEVNIKHRDAARRITLATVNTITRSYNTFKTKFVQSSTMGSMLPVASPVGGVYLISQDLGGRQLTVEDTLYSASLLIYLFYDQRVTLPIWSDEIHRESSFISGFGTSSIIFPWRYIKAFATRFVLGKIYDSFEKEHDDPILASLPGLPDNDKMKDDIFLKLIESVLTTNRNLRNELLSNYHNKIENTIQKLSEEMAGYQQQINQLQAEITEKTQLYKMIGMIAMGVCPILLGTLAWLLADPTNLLDYLSLPQLIAAGAAIGSAVGGGILFYCIKVLAKKAVKEIEERLNSLRVEESELRAKIKSLRSFDEEVASLKTQLPQFFLLDKEILDFERLPLELPPDEHQVPGTSVYLLSDKLSPPNQSLAVLREHLKNSKWLDKVCKEAENHYKILIVQSWGQKLWETVQQKNIDDEIFQKVRTEFSKKLSEYLESLIKPLAHLGDGVVLRLSKLSSESSSNRKTMDEILLNWIHLSRPSLPLQVIEPSRIQKRLFINDDITLVREYFPPSFHSAQKSTIDPRLMLKYEFVHGIEPWELGTYFQNSTDGTWTKILNWLDFSLSKQVESVEDTLVTALFTGINYKLPGIEVLRLSDEFALDIDADIDSTFLLKREPSRYYLKNHKEDLQQHGSEVDKMLEYYYTVGKLEQKSLEDYFHELRYERIEDKVLWKITYEATKNTDFFTIPTEEQVSQIRSLAKKLVQQSEIELSKVEGDERKDWRSAWVKEVGSRIQAEMPKVDLDVDEVLDSTRLKTNGDNSVPESWKKHADALIEKYSLLTERYLLILKAMYLYCISGKRFGLKKIKVLMITKKDVNVLLGESLCEVKKTLMSDSVAFKAVGSLVQPWAHDPDYKILFNTMKDKLTKIEGLCDKPFSQLLSLHN